MRYGPAPEQNSNRWKADSRQMDKGETCARLRQEFSMHRGREARAAWYGGVSTKGGMIKLLEGNYRTQRGQTRRLLPTADTLRSTTPRCSCRTATVGHDRTRHRKPPNKKTCVCVCVCVSYLFVHVLDDIHMHGIKPTSEQEGERHDPRRKETPKRTNIVTGW